MAGKSLAAFHKSVDEILKDPKYKPVKLQIAAISNTIDAQESAIESLLAAIDKYKAHLDKLYKDLLDAGKSAKNDEAKKIIKSVTQELSREVKMTTGFYGQLNTTKRAYFG